MNEKGRAGDLPKLFLANGYGFFLAAARIAGAGVGPDFPWPPFFVNIGYAFELSLKAYVLQHGGTEELCRNAIRHDLSRAIVESRSRGLAQPSDDVYALLSKIGPYHRDHSFRYMTPIDETALPDVAHTLVVTNQHLSSIAKQLSELLP